MIFFSECQDQGAPKGRQQKGETGPGTNIFADRFSLIFGSLCKSRHLGVADSRRKPQIFAGNRRKPQIFAETGFSHLLTPFWRALTGGQYHWTENYLHYIIFFVNLKANRKGLSLKTLGKHQNTLAAKKAEKKIQNCDLTSKHRDLNTQSRDLNSKTAT